VVDLDPFESFPEVNLILSLLFWCPSLRATGLRLVHVVVVRPWAFLAYICSCRTTLGGHQGMRPLTSSGPMVPNLVRSQFLSPCEVTQGMELGTLQTGYSLMPP
jgi:hypothetical protein